MDMSWIAATALMVALVPAEEIHEQSASEEQPSASQSTAEEAPEEGEAEPKRAGLSRTFAPTGLLAEFNSNENFGTIQGRLGIYRTHQATANATGINDGFRDTVDNFIFPLKATVAIPGEQDDWYVRAAVTGAFARGKPGNLTRNSVDSYTGQLHLIRRFGDRTAISLGLVATDVSIDLRHNGGSITNTGLGVQMDVMHQVTPQFGVAGHVIFDGVERNIAIPVTGGGELSTTFNGERIYAEGNLVFNLRGEQSAIVPNGWLLRPVLTGVFQNIALGPTVNSRGAQIQGFGEDFGALFFTTRLEKSDFRPWKLVPYVEAGAELTMLNDASSVDDDDANTYLRAGIATNIGGAGRLDFSAIRRDSLQGSFSATNFSILLTTSF